MTTCPGLKYNILYGNILVYCHIFYICLFPNNSDCSGTIRECKRILVGTDLTGNACLLERWCLRETWWWSNRTVFSLNWLKLHRNGLPLFLLLLLSSLSTGWALSLSGTHAHTNKMSHYISLSIHLIFKLTCYQLQPRFSSSLMWFYTLDTHPDEGSFMVYLSILIDRILRLCCILCFPQKSTYNASHGFLHWNGLSLTTQGQLKSFPPALSLYTGTHCTDITKQIQSSSSGPGSCEWPTCHFLFVRLWV